MWPPLFVDVTNRRELLQAILHVILKSNADDSLKVYYLISLQEHLQYFFVDDINFFYVVHEQFAQVLIKHGEIDDNEQFNFFLVDGQMLVFLTTAIVELDIMNKNVTLFQNWVQFLLSIATQANRSVNRVYRQMACECLHELETNYAGLLSNYVFLFLRWCQFECTHALQSYMNLMMLTLDHWCQKVRINIFYLFLIFMNRSCNNIIQN